MVDSTPTVEFYDGIAEEISNVSLRQNRSTGVKTVLLSFERLRAIEKFRNFRSRFSKALKLTGEGGSIRIEP